MHIHIYHLSAHFHSPNYRFSDFGHVFVAKKNGLSNNEKLYALKAIYIPRALALTTSNALNAEREVILQIY